MKIQCPCGAKFAFDTTPEMVENPVQFVCPNCGLDSSDFVNGLIRQEFAPEAPAGAPTPVAAAGETRRMRVALAQPPAGQTSEATAAADTPQFCLKHNNQPATHRCLVCQKPICPKCMELFGYVCSPFCKSKAEALKINIPVYEGQRLVVEAKFGKKVGRISTAVGAVVAVLLGFWFWYAWFGSVPHPAFSVRFADRAYSGEVRLCGTNQIVFLHGGTLARYDLKSKKEIWSHELITRQQIADEAAQMSKLGGRLGRQPAQDKLAGMIEREMTSGLLLRISGQNLWVSAPGKLTHYDWNTGRVLQEIPLTEGSGEFIARGDELLMLKESETGRQFITHISLANGETHTEIIGRTGKPAVASSQNAPGAMVMASAGGAGGPPTAGLPVGAPGADMGKPMDPAKVAAQAQSLPLPARIALPAVLANSMHQERIQSELDDQPRSPEQQAASAPRQVAAKPPPIEPFSLIPGKYGYVQFAVRLLESRIVTREAMKAPPKRSVLDGDLNITKTVDAANEILNDMQRSRGGNIVEEDVSRYQVTLRRPDSTETRDWTGEVIGPPGLFPLKTVNVLTAGKTLVVFDKTNKKLWQSALTHPVTGGAGARGGEEARLGEGPCVERGDTLFVFDQAVLTAFDLATGNARWRLPSVGVAGLFFDDQGMLYVNTTTASPENIKYSRQIDISDKTDAVFLKIDPRTGKTLWSIKPGGFISYLSGKYIYTFQSYDPGDEEDGATMLAGVSPNPPFVRIRRINPENGRILWDYQQGRAPFDVQFNGNSIGLVFKKEVQVLKFLSF